MIELHLENTIIAFDGRVLEAFPQGQVASRYHIADIIKVGIISDKKGAEIQKVRPDLTN